MAVLVWLGVGVGTARADTAHTEMAQALQAQADLHPGPARLPTTSAAPQHAAGPSAVKRGLPPGGASAADHANAAQGQGQSQTALANQARGQAAAAAGQAQAQAAKARAASHSHPGK